MKNHWLLILIMSVTAGLLLSYLRDPATFHLSSDPERPFVPVSEDKRASILLPEAKGFAAKPLAARVYGMPTALANLLTVAAAVGGRRAQPVSINLDQPPREWETLIEALPDTLKAQLASRLEGVYLTSNLGSSAMTDYLFGTLSDDRPLGAFIALDLGAFLGAPGRMTTLDAWMESREAGVFKLAKGDRIEARLEAAPGVEWPLEFALLRELGHVFAVNASVHPPWLLSLWSGETNARYPFLSVSWTLKPRGFEIRPADDFPLRAKIVSDGRGTIPSANMKAAYEALEKTSFPTLLAAVSPFDDFAESFATYVHTVILKRPFELRVIHGGKVVQTLHSCWTEKRCAAKRAILETLLNTAR